MRYGMMTIVLLVACQPAVPSTAQKASPSSAPKLELIVANQQSASASVLSDDGTTMRHIAVGEGPHEAIISPDGSIGVVSIYGTRIPGNQLAVVDLARDSVLRTIDLGSYQRPHGMAFIGNDKLAVTSEASQNLVIVDLTAGTVETAIPTQARGSHMVALTANGKFAYTANVADNSVSEIDVANRKFVRKFTVPPRPEGITVTPNGAEVWVGSNQTGAVSVITPSSGAVAHTITGAVFPYRLGASPDGRLVAIVDGEGSKLHVASVADHRFIGAIAIEQPRGVVIASDNRTAYVTQAAGSVSMVDLQDLKIVKTLTVQASPDGVGVGLRR